MFCQLSISKWMNSALVSVLEWGGSIISHVLDAAIVDNVIQIVNDNTAVSVFCWSTGIQSNVEWDKMIWISVPVEIDFARSKDINNTPMKSHIWFRMLCNSLQIGSVLNFARIMVLSNISHSVIYKLQALLQVMLKGRKSSSPSKYVSANKHV